MDAPDLAFGKPAASTGAGVRKAYVVGPKAHDSGIAEKFPDMPHVKALPLISQRGPHGTLAHEMKPVRIVGYRDRNIGSGTRSFQLFSIGIQGLVELRTPVLRIFALAVVCPLRRPQVLPCL